MNGVLGLIIFFLLTVWLIVLTLLLRKSQKHYLRLTHGVDGKNISSILEHVVSDSQKTKKELATLIERCATIEKESQLHIQKIGLLRFNPFKDTGGDQSFILSLLDQQDSGIVISGLYSRSGTRWYAKRVIKGQGQEHDLSDEEKKAIRMAK